MQNVLGKEELAKDMCCSAGKPAVCVLVIEAVCKLMNSRERFVREEAGGEVRWIEMG